MSWYKRRNREDWPFLDGQNRGERLHTTSSGSDPFERVGLSMVIVTNETLTNNILDIMLITTCSSPFFPVKQASMPTLILLISFSQW
jgi:hypothetical protein